MSNFTETNDFHIKKLSEAELTAKYVAMLRENGIKAIATEVNLMWGDSIIDVAYIDEEKRMVCVELKLHDWKKVIKQALQHRRYVTEIYIVMPLPQRQCTIKKIEDACREYGLGIYWFDNNKFFVSMVPAIKECEIDSYFNRKLDECLFKFMQLNFVCKCLEY
jgi:hypothetical protein